MLFHFISLTADWIPTLIHRQLILIGLFCQLAFNKNEVIPSKKVRLMPTGYVFLPLLKSLFPLNLYPNAVSV